MLEQQVDHRLAGHIVIGIEAQRLKIFVLPHQIRRGIRKQIHDPLKACPVQRGFQILDHVELDAALTQNLERSARLPSARVVVNLESFHSHRLLNAICQSAFYLSGMG